MTSLRQQRKNASHKKSRGPRGPHPRQKVSQKATKSLNAGDRQPILSCKGLTEIPVENLPDIPVLALTGFPEVPVQPPVFIPAPEPVPVANPYAVLFFVLAGGEIAVSQLVERLRIKQEPAISKREANNRVIKLSDAYEVIDRVCNSPTQILEIGVRLVAACWHAIQPHFPRWLDLSQATADFGEEIMNRLVTKLKDGMALKVLQQCNLRQQGTWSTIDMADIETLKLRLGKLHPR